VAGRGRVVIVAVALLGYAALLLSAGAGVLARARWADRAPRLAVAAWLALTGSAVMSLILGGLALVVPTVRISAGLSTLLAACAMALRARYAHPGGAALAGAGAVLGLAGPAAAVSGQRYCPQMVTAAHVVPSSGPCAASNC